MVNEAEENMFGDELEEFWNDGSQYYGVREILVVYSRQCIYSIRVVYIDKKGAEVKKETHGGEAIPEYTNDYTIKLHYPDEFLTKVSGYHGTVAGSNSLVIRSLKFESNLNRDGYGPYGKEDGRHFSFSKDGAMIVGFKGRSHHHLNAIGFHLSDVKPTVVVKKMVNKSKSKYAKKKKKKTG